MRVLIVEDHADTRTVLALLLNRSGCKTVTAKTLHEARARVATMQFDFLICDLGLPDGDGVVLASEAKQKQSLTTIALTGRATIEARNEGLNAGFD
jgi:DNA-binding response OmpR family regulator